MKIFIINLEHATERREYVEKQLKDQQLEYEFVNGVFGKNLTAKEKSEHYNDKKAFRNQCRSLVDSEIGIAISHINIYRKIIEGDLEFALILEDDVVLPEKLGLYLGLIQSKISTNIPNLILLSPAETSDDKVQLDSNYKLEKYKNGFYASSYVVNKAAAKALFKELYPVNDVADCWLRLSKHKVVDIKAVVPALITQDQESFGSSTTDDLNLNRLYNLPKKIKFKFCRTFWLGIDLFVAFYHRHFRPYAGILKK